MPVTRTEEGTFHEVRRAAGLAASLLDHGHPDDMRLAGDVIRAVVRCQLDAEGHPHHGNYRWMLEDDAVTDLNAAAFVCCAWLPARLRYRGGLPDPVQRAWDRSIRRAVGAIERLDVSPAYTNIAVMDATARVLAGQALGDDDLIERGHRRLRVWTAWTAEDGHPFEFNAPTYTRITFRTLLVLSREAEREDTRRLARAMAHRLGLSIALHLHPGTGRWSGPHGRAYRPCVDPAGDEGARARDALARPDAPAWLARVRPAEGDLVETASRETGQALVTHHHADFALGTATAAFLDQANRIVLHARDGRAGSAVAYTRFLTDDRDYGDVRHSSDRTRGRHLPDEGRAFVVQEGPRCIALYAPVGSLANRRSAATVLSLAPGRAGVVVQHHGTDGARRIEPGGEVPDEGVLIVEMGRVRLAVVLLTRTQLAPAPSMLERRGQELRITWTHYRGVRNEHWETMWPGPYYQGPPVCGLFLEAAGIGDHASAEAFAADIERDRPTVEYDPPVTYSGREIRAWSATARRNGAAMSLSVDVLGWTCLGRTLGDGTPFDWPAISSPQVVSGSRGRLEAFGATYTGPPGPAWLFGDPDRSLWAAGRLFEAPGATELTVPGGAVRDEGPGAVTLVWDRGTAAVDRNPLRDATESRVATGSGGSAP